MLIYVNYRRRAVASATNGSIVDCTSFWPEAEGAYVCSYVLAIARKSKYKYSEVKETMLFLSSLLDKTE